MSVGCRGKIWGCRRWEGLAAQQVRFLRIYLSGLVAGCWGGVGRTGCWAFIADAHGPSEDQCLWPFDAAPRPQMAGNVDQLMAPHHGGEVVGVTVWREPASTTRGEELDDTAVTAGTTPRADTARGRSPTLNPRRGPRGDARRRTGRPPVGVDAGTSPPHHHRGRSTEAANGRRAPRVDGPGFHVAEFMFLGTRARAPTLAGVPWSVATPDRR